MLSLHREHIHELKADDGLLEAQTEKMHEEQAFLLSRIQAETDEAKKAQLRELWAAKENRLESIKTQQMVNEGGVDAALKQVLDDQMDLSKQVEDQKDPEQKARLEALLRAKQSKLEELTKEVVQDDHSAEIAEMLQGEVELRKRMECEQDVNSKRQMAKLLEAKQQKLSKKLAKEVTFYISQHLLSMQFVCR
jgi:hypothetical protein